MKKSCDKVQLSCETIKKRGGRNMNPILERDMKEMCDDIQKLSEEDVKYLNVAVKTLLMKQENEEMQSA
jgi:hypothetical protein